MQKKHLILTTGKASLKGNIHLTVQMVVSNVNLVHFYWSFLWNMAPWIVLWRLTWPILPPVILWRNFQYEGLRLCGSSVATFNYYHHHSHLLANLFELFFGNLEKHSSAGSINQFSEKWQWRNHVLSDENSKHFSCFQRQNLFWSNFIWYSQYTVKHLVKCAAISSMAFQNA